MNIQQMIEDSISGKEIKPDETAKIEAQKELDHQHWLNNNATREKLGQLQIQIARAYNYLAEIVLDPLTKDSDVRHIAANYVMLRNLFDSLIKP